MGTASIVFVLGWTTMKQTGKAFVFCQFMKNGIAAFVWFQTFRGACRNFQARTSGCRAFTGCAQRQAQRETVRRGWEGPWIYSGEAPLGHDQERGKEWVTYCCLLVGSVSWTLGNTLSLWAPRWFFVPQRVTPKFYRTALLLPLCKLLWLLCQIFLAGRCPERCSSLQV